MKRLFLLSLATLLHGCGGGGGGERPNTLTPVRLSGSTPVELHRIDQLRQHTKVNGQDILIGVIGSGVNLHIELNGRISPASFGVYQGNMKGGMEYTGDGSDPVTLDESTYHDVPGYGHETGTSSLVSGATLGAAPAATLIEAKVFWHVTSTQGDEYDQTTIPILRQAFNELIQRNTQVINASITFQEGTQGSLTLLTDYPGGVADTIRNAVNNDIAVTLAAGNTGSKEALNAFRATRTGAETLYEDPTIMKKILIGYSYNKAKQDISEWSNRPGSQADCNIETRTLSEQNQCKTIISAAQHAYIGVWSENIVVASAEGNSNYLIASGTSYAAPILAGTYALVKQGWPWLSSEQIVQILKESADTSIYDRHFPGWQNDPVKKDLAMARFGVGLLDAEAALAPIGSLSTSSTSQQQYDPSSFQLILPSNKLTSIKTALAHTQAFDRFGRNFTIDLSNRVYHQKGFNPQQMAEVYPLQKVILSPYSQLKIAADGTVALNVATQRVRLTFGKGKALRESIQSPIELGELSYQHYARAEQLDLHGKTLFFSGQYKTQTQTGTLNRIMRFFNYRNFTVGVGIEEGKQPEGLLSFYGEGAGQLGRGKFLLNRIQLRWRNTHQQLNILWRYGSAKSVPVMGGFFQLKDLMLAQLSLNYQQNLTPWHKWGLSLWSSLRPIRGKLSWKIPTGVNPSNGTSQYSEGHISLNETLIPDHITLFYQYQW